MSSRVVVTNRSNLTFKPSIISFSEIEESVEKFWENRFSDLLMPEQEAIVFGKLFHTDNLPTGANLVVSIILSIESNSNEETKENLIILKSRIKGSKTGSKTYAYVSSFPEKLPITKPHWHKGNSKHYFLTYFLAKTIQVTFSVSWNDNILFVIEELKEEPVFNLLSTKAVKDNAIEEFYENQWKTKTGHGKYTHSPVSIHNHRPAYSTVHGDHVLPKCQIMAPIPLWIWLDDWHLDSSFAENNGWVYLDDWKSATKKPENSTKFRFRRWIRTRTLKKNMVESDYNCSDFISNHFNLVVNSLEDIFPPFLRELKREVASNPVDFDFSSIAAIPSPRLRRELKVLSL